MILVPFENGRINIKMTSLTYASVSLTCAPTRATLFAEPDANALDARGVMEIVGLRAPSMRTVGRMRAVEAIPYTPIVISHKRGTGMSCVVKDILYKQTHALIRERTISHRPRKATAADFGLCSCCHANVEVCRINRAAKLPHVAKLPRRHNLKSTRAVTKWTPVRRSRK